MTSRFLFTSTKIDISLLPNQRTGYSNAITRVSIRPPPPGFDYRTETAVDSVVALERNRDLLHLKDLVEEGTLVVVEKRRFGPVPSWRSEFVEPDEIWLVGTSHVSEKSAVDVDRVVRAVMPERVVVELCRSRQANPLLSDFSSTSFILKLNYDKILMVIGNPKLRVVNACYR